MIFDNLQPRASLRLLGAASILALAVSSPVAAQVAPAETVGQADAVSPSESGNADIVVTGSRVSRPGYDQPTPTTVVGAAELENRGVVNIADVLQTIPAFNGSSNASTSVIAGTGAVYLNLRSLGAVRTLVLVDGARVVPTSGTGTFDLNLIPTAALERTEIVTGGASAAYGSDAVAGVVNLITRHNFNGFRAQVRAGISQYGDGANQSGSILWGTGGLDGRLHLTVAGEVENRKGVGDLTNRDWSSRNRQLFGPNLYDYVNLRNARPGTFLFGTTSLGTNTAFNAQGVPYIAVQGTALSTGNAAQQSGGDNPYGYFPFLIPLAKPVLRASGLVNLSYDFSDSFHATLGLLYGHTETEHKTLAYSSIGVATIQPDNAFLPANVRLSGPTLFGRLSSDLYATLADDNDTYSARLLLDGKLGDNWKWDALGQYGLNKEYRRNPTAVYGANFLRAIDAVRNGSGQVVCRVNADASTTNDDPACAPLNIFGVNQFSQAAYDYVTEEGWARTRLERVNFAANLRGDLFSTWAGPISVATGYEYRRDEVSGMRDALSNAGALSTAPSLTSPGKIAINEVYGEAVVPLLKDMSFAKSLDLNGAIRRAWYDPGSGITTWKAGATYEVNDMLRFRGTISRDIRAPNIAELYSGGAISTMAVTNNPNQTGATVPVLSGGNINLAPERALTESAGFSIKSGGFHLALDYYDIKLRGVIAAPGTTTSIVNNCLVLNVPEFCALLTFSNGGPPGNITQVDNRLTNLALRRATGVDFDIGYDMPLGNGRLSASLLGTYTIHRTQRDGSGTYDYANVSAGGYLHASDFATPRWLMYGTLSYSDDSWGLTLNSNYVSRSRTDPTASTTGGTGNMVNYDFIDARLYFNLTARFKVGSNFEFFTGVENLTNQDPPSTVPLGLIGQGNTTGYYDVVGRRFFAGARVQF